jgi:hypothetical protein
LERTTENQHFASHTFLSSGLATSHTMMMIFFSGHEFNIIGDSNIEEKDDACNED